jgi:hypothetical protein
MTSAGDVFVRIAFSSALFPAVMRFAMPRAEEVTELISPREYACNALNRPIPASLARLGSFCFPVVE